MNELQRLCHLCPRSAVCAVDGAWQSQLDNETTHFGFRRIICHPWAANDDRVRERSVFYISPEQHNATKRAL